MLEDEGQHGGPEELDHARRRWRDVLDLGLRRGGDDLGRDLGGLLRAPAEGVGLALFGDPLDDDPVDLALESPAEEDGVVLVDGIDGIHPDLDDRLLACAEALLDVGRRDEHDVDGSVAEVERRPPPRPW